MNDSSLDIYIYRHCNKKRNQLISPYCSYLQYLKHSEMTLLKHVLVTLLLVGLQCQSDSCGIEHCESCNLLKQCNRCSSGFDVYFGRCCSNNCANCSSTGACQKCSKGYENIKDVCYGNFSQGARIGIIIGAAIAFVVLVTILAVYFKRRTDRQFPLTGGIIIGQSAQAQVPQYAQRNGQQNMRIRQEADSSQTNLQQFAGLPSQYPAMDQGALYRSRDSCTICLSNNTNIRTSCTHQFHASCILTWCKLRYACPDCQSERFNLIAMCPKCGQFKNRVKICRPNCRQADHLVCFQGVNRSKLVCKECQRSN